MSISSARKYSTVNLIEGQFEDRSDGCVYKNLLGIKTKVEIDKIEAKYLADAYRYFIGFFSANHRFSVMDIQLLHKIWLEKIYSWAGKYRQVNLSKGGFLFAAATEISRLMLEFEKKELTLYTPCNFSKSEDVVRAIAIVHNELILIHPFREGNGRVSRMLADLMALQAGLPLLDYSEIEDEKREEYFMAVGAGLDHNYGPMMEIFRSVIDKTLKKS